MIVTVTLNPALDKTAELDALTLGGLNRLRNIVTDAGGKGINVSKMIAALGGVSVATGFVGGIEGGQLVRMIAQDGIRSEFIQVNGRTRTNLKVLDQGARLTEFNEPGVVVSEQEAANLIGKIADYAGADSLFVLSGSLCQGVETEFYARLIRIIHNSGGVVFLDADGDAFRAALTEKPDFIKPNSYELIEYFHIGEVTGLEELNELCLRFLELGVHKFALSMGVDGALFVDGEQTLYAPGLAVEAHSAVGAGDSMLGAFAYAAEYRIPWDQASALALASSAGAVMTAGTKPPERRLVDQLMERVQMKVLRI